MGLFRLLKWLFKPSPEALGRRGEELVKYDLETLVHHGRPGKILRNVYIPTNNGHTVEIDLLFITAKGLFVIESKNYAGYIFGNERNKNWTETLYGGKDVFGFKHVEKRHFYNPIWQNQTHIRCLKRFLDKDYKFISLIVFSGNCELKSVSVESADTIVCYEKEVAKQIYNYWALLQDSISDTEVESIYSELVPLTEIDEEKRLKHIQQVNAAKYDIRDNRPKEADKTVSKCPWCGGALVLRTAKHGPNTGSQFYGCSNFPKCRYTKNK